MRPACSALIVLLTLSGCGAATSWTKDDPSISTHVKIALLNDPQVAPYRIAAKTSGGIVTLSGTVKTQVERDRAMDVARKVKGVKDVRSELKVASLPLPVTSAPFESDLHARREFQASMKSR